MSRVDELTTETHGNSEGQNSFHGSGLISLWGYTTYPKARSGRPRFLDRIQRDNVTGLGHTSQREKEDSENSSRMQFLISSFISSYICVVV